MRKYFLILLFLSDFIYASYAGRDFYCVDESGKKIIDCVFEQICPFKNGIAAACVKDAGWGFIDSTGKIIIDFQYAAAGDFSEGLAAVSKKVNGKEKLGFIDMQGNVVIDFLYFPRFYRQGVSDDEYPVFREGKAAVSLDGKKYGYINRNGENITDFIFDRAMPFNKYRAYVRKDGQSFYINSFGVIHNPEDLRKGQTTFNGNRVDKSYETIIWNDIKPLYDTAIKQFKERYRDDKYHTIEHSSFCRYSEGIFIIMTPRKNTVELLQGNYNDFFEWLGK